MGNTREWRVLLTCPDLAAATPVADYLNLPDCPAFVAPVPPSFNLTPTAAVLVPAEFLPRAQHIWSTANILGDLTEGELEFIVTGKLPGTLSGSHKHDDAA
jgi:hypothetical protein